MNLQYFKYFLIATVSLASCSKLEENLNSQINNTGAATSDPTSLLNASYNAVYAPLASPWGMWSLEEFTSDEAIVPTRAGDWDDNGAWRALFLHSWKADHVRILEAFRGLTGLIYTAQDVLRFNPSTQQAAEARFLRAFAEFHLLSGWGQVPYRDPGESLAINPRVRNATDEISYLISELDAITENLPENGQKFKANRDAARILKMKILLNKGAFLNKQNPTFDAADMQQVVSLANEIITSNKYSLQNNYFDNFAPTNGEISNEIIFTSQNSAGQALTGMEAFTYATCHYNMSPSGWNGFSTLSNFYDKFEASDQRIGGSYPGLTNVTGLRVGFLIGQQYKIENGQQVALKDRKNNPLIFDSNLSIIEKDPNHLEVAGIRVIKYVFDHANIKASNSVNNDYVHFRYADVLLMKAEALLRSSNAAEALIIVNNLRLKRGASPLGSLNEANLIDELGREFYWEGHRRTDLIRFGKYLDTWQEKPSDDPKYLLFPIPQNQLSNPNYTQNPGY